MNEEALKEIIEKYTLRQLDNNNCFMWTGSRNKSDGRARLTFENRATLAARFVAHLYMNFNLESKLLICHTCDNKLCVNPKHLFIGTQSDNRSDMHMKGRHIKSFWKDKCPKGHEYTPENTYWSGRSKRSRHCKPCMLANKKRYYAAKKQKTFQWGCTLNLGEEEKRGIVVPNFEPVPDRIEVPEREPVKEPEKVPVHDE